MRFLSIEPLLEDLDTFNISGLDWAIIGGESGHGARPMKEEWVEKILKLCRRERVAFFSSNGVAFTNLSPVDTCMAEPMTKCLSAWSLPCQRKKTVLKWHGLSRTNHRCGHQRSKLDRCGLEWVKYGKRYSLQPSQLA